MALVELVMPKLGESIMEATILKWHKKAGDHVKQDETVLEIATDKVDSEVPSTAEGILEEVLFNVNDVVPIGTAIAKIRTEGAAAEPRQPAATKTETTAPTPPKAVSPSSNGQKNSGAVNRFYSPLVLNIAQSEGISMSELEQIPGSGNEGRVTKSDILKFVSDKGRSASPDSRTPPNQPVNQSTNQLAKVIHEPPAQQYSGNVEIMEMDRMRKLIADHMVRSKHTSPHVTSFTESDVTNLVMWREKVKKDFEKREGTKITFTPLFVEAIVRCIKKYPLINSSIDGSNIIIKKDINIGMATALPSGNLIVPVIRNADQLNLVGLAKQVNTLAENARTGKLKPDDTQGGTFTLTNVGTFGSLMGTPIINQPQVAILAVGAIKKRPVVVETPHGDSIAIRHMMYLSMSYDHRIVDGALGATFLTAVARELENFKQDRDF
ncbi:MAG: 2-oxo acid dehydrogenase subunit E2 [Gemmatimonadaceae bacterium]|nr:2-oxo acid dehydrogenase subunit E2 [Chitinophagaceae bacterium]